MKKRLFLFLRYILFLGLGLGILMLLYRSQNANYKESCALKGIPEAECSLLDKVLTDFANVDYRWIAMALLLFLISNVSRAIRWNMLIHPLGVRPRFINSIGAILIGYFANLGLPRVGEIVRAGILSRYEHIGAEKVMGTIVVDRIIDVISIMLVTLVAFIVEFDTISTFVNENVSFVGRFGGLGRIVLFAAVLGGLVVGLFYLFRNHLKDAGWFKKITNLVQGFGEGLRSIGKVERPWLFILHSINVWGMYVLMTYCLMYAFEAASELPWEVGLVVFTFGAWGIVVPSPGGMGTYHYMVQTALSIYGISGEDGFSWANIAFFSINLGTNVLLGLMALMILPAFNRRNPVQSTTAEA